MFGAVRTTLRSPSHPVVHLLQTGRRLVHTDLKHMVVTVVHPLVNRWVMVDLAMTHLTNCGKHDHVCDAGIA